MVGNYKQKEMDYLALMLYSNIIQQNISYMATLEMRILSLKNEMLRLKKKLDDIDMEISSLKLKLENLKQKRDKEIEKDKAIVLANIDKLKADLKMVQPFYIIQPPVNSPFPVKPRKLLILIVSVITGAFVGIFLALFYQNLKSYSK